MVGCLLLAAGCKKVSSDEITSRPYSELNPAKIYHLPQTADEKLLVQNLTKLTGVFQDLFVDERNRKVVYAAIFAKAYTDESVLAKDLIYPANSILPGNKKFKKYEQAWNVSLKQFSEKFWAVAKGKNDAGFNTYLESLNSFHAPASRIRGQNSISLNNTYNDNGGGTSIYMPYSDMIMPPADDPGGYYAPITTLATATADADEGWGTVPYTDGSGNTTYTQVLVNDDFAYNNPTMIIGVNGIEPYVETNDLGTAFPPTDPIDVPNLPREVKQVYTGDVRIDDKQYDALISITGNGGGSEIRFTRADGFLTVVTGQVSTASVYFTPAQTIGRYEIRKNKWVDFAYEWDADWEDNNLQQNIACYEEDNRNESTFNGSLSTTVTLPAAGGAPSVAATRTIGFTVSYKSDDELIFQQNLNRDVFFPLNRQNICGSNQWYANWPVRNCSGPLYYTLNDRTLF